MSDEAQEAQQLPWSRCEVHTHHTDHDCEYCEKQLAEQQAFLDDLQAKCQQANAKLAQLHNGVPYIETQVAVPTLMVETITEMIFSDPKAMMAYQLNFFTKLMHQMQMVHQASVRNTIMSNGGSRVIPPDQQKILRKMQGGG